MNFPLKTNFFPQIRLTAQERSCDQGNGYGVDEPKRSRLLDVLLTDEQRSVYRQEKREDINIDTNL
ncbi:uncharacterized protein PHALS_08803 [Plasmopara halstedii]|uniref:Uncharacterized protein n=1 Tax=Plasmopara halstedii TaxID=4781 RepID=A0A0P1ADS0_PLAHL|nr:uncharacterized protein PHALS_08803 [Plasmopara halstedii]CEG38749.1 hypothetical protein PHALS_08803 [Plasmopara halstedii]|eukprot:XP_024575118.1 hypothetical protein PHALS_08803 [Plasmopara halstedii]